jgi:signal transduction histidine kinase
LFERLLRVVCGGAHQLRRSADEAVTRGAARIGSSAARMNRLIRDLMDVARVRGGTLQLQPVEVELGELAREVIDELALLHPGRIELVATGETRGYWDRDRLAQILQNLVANALAHGAAHSPIRVRVDGDEKNATLAVANAGAPIPEALRASIFDPLRRSKHSAGLGLGLYIVKQVVDAHAGAVAVVSDNRETVFRVSLPRRGPAP